MVVVLFGVPEMSFRELCDLYNMVKPIPIPFLRSSDSKQNLILQFHGTWCYQYTSESSS